MLAKDSGDKNALPEGVFTLRPKQALYVCGDPHGDLSVVVSWLRDCARVMDGRGDWIGKGAYVVVCGDLIDRRRGPQPEARLLDGQWVPGVATTGERMDEEFEILHVLNRLHVQASAERPYPGAVVKIMGNHDLMAVRQNIEYSDAFATAYARHASGDLGGVCRLRRFAPSGDINREYAAGLGVHALVRVYKGSESWLLCHGGVPANLLSRLKATDVDIDSHVRALNRRLRELVSSRKPELNGDDDDDDGLRSALTGDIQEIMFNRDWGEGASCCAPHRCSVFRDAFRERDDGAFLNLVVSHCVQVSDLMSGQVDGRFALVRASRSRGGRGGRRVRLTRRVHVPSNGDALLRNCQFYEARPQGARRYRRFNFANVSSITSACEDRIWAVDCGCSRAFDAVDDQRHPCFLSMRRPQVLRIGRDRASTCVLKANYDLPRRLRGGPPPAPPALDDVALDRIVYQSACCRTGEHWVQAAARAVDGAKIPRHGVSLSTIVMMLNIRAVLKKAVFTAHHAVGVGGSGRRGRCVPVYVAREGGPGRSNHHHLDTIVMRYRVLLRALRRRLRGGSFSIRKQQKGVTQENKRAAKA